MARFDDAIPTVLNNEGGYVFDPADPGGETKFGISKHSYPNLDIKNLTVEDAVAIYRRDFWMFDGVNDQTLATKIFDTYVNEEHTGIRILQQCLYMPSIDGIWGTHTCGAVNSASPVGLLITYREALAQHYRNVVLANPAEAKFLNGWLRRAAQ